LQNEKKTKNSCKQTMFNPRQTSIQTLKINIF